MDKGAIIKAGKCIVQLLHCGGVGDASSLVFGHDGGPFGGVVRWSVSELN